MTFIILLLATLSTATADEPKVTIIDFEEIDLTSEIPKPQLTLQIVRPPKEFARGELIRELIIGKPCVNCHKIDLPTIEELELD